MSHELSLKSSSKLISTRPDAWRHDRSYDGSLITTTVAYLIATLFLQCIDELWQFWSLIKSFTNIWRSIARNLFDCRHDLDGRPYSKHKSDVYHWMSETWSKYRCVTQSSAVMQRKQWCSAVCANTGPKVGLRLTRTTSSSNPIRPDPTQP